METQLDVALDQYLIIVAALNAMAPKFGRDSRALGIG